LKYPTSDETRGRDGGGFYNRFQGGSIYAYPGLGAYEVLGALDKTYQDIGGETSVLGYPTIGERGLNDGGRFNHFQRGSIYAGPGLGAFEIHGDIRDRWAALGWELSPLKYPTSNETKGKDGVGAYNRFQTNSSIYAYPGVGAYEVLGDIHRRYMEMDGEASLLRYPILGERKTSTGGYFSHFQGGSIYAYPGLGGAHDVLGKIQERWGQLGWETGRMGYPTTNTIKNGDIWRSNFQGGWIEWNTRTGVVTNS
jgi:uncharacterized protein with LGFP repeats